MRRYCFSALIAICALWGSGIVHAETPLTSVFTYQGRLSESGSPVSDTADFQFSLWDAAVAGNQIGENVSVDNVVVADGLFSVSLDFGATAFDGSARWLEIAVRHPSGSGAYTTLSPRQVLTAAPYALHAVNSEALSSDVDALQLDVQRLNGVADANTFNWLVLQPFLYGTGNPFTQTDVVPRFRVGISAHVQTDDPPGDPIPTCANTPVLMGWNWLGNNVLENDMYPGFGLRFEPWFRWPSGNSKVCEFHYQYNPPTNPEARAHVTYNRTGAWRPIAINVTHESGFTGIDLSGNKFSWLYQFGGPNGTTSVQKMQLNAEAGQFHLSDGTDLYLDGGYLAIDADNGDDIVLRYRNGDIEIGNAGETNVAVGDWRFDEIPTFGAHKPTKRISLMPFITDKSTGTLMDIGALPNLHRLLAFDDVQDAEYYYADGITIGDDWDLSSTAVISVHVRLAPLAATGAGSSKVTLDCFATHIEDGAAIDSPAADTWEAADFDFDMGTAVAAHQSVSTTILTMSNLNTTLAAGDSLSFSLRRKGDDADDNFASSIGLLDWWIEVAKKQP